MGLSLRNLSLSLAGGVLAVSTAHAYTGDQIAVGYDLLATELGGSLPTGAGVPVTQVEADYSNNGSNLYLPDPYLLTGKTGSALSGGSIGTNISDHASYVSNNFFGAGSVSPGVTTVNFRNVDGPVATNFLVNYLNYNSGNPLTDSGRVQNHSWAGNLPGDTGFPITTQLIQRFDYAIERDRFVAVVGLQNGSATPVPTLLAGSYNAITVGLSNGNHSVGTSTGYDAGRAKPDLVAPGTLAIDPNIPLQGPVFPGNYVSFAAPLVSSASAMLLSYADAHANTVNARNHSEVIKSVLMAGATKTGLSGPAYVNDAATGLSSVYGAGQLNVYNSYHILSAGEQNASAVSFVSSKGWDYGSTATGGQVYLINVPTGGSLSDLKAVLTWNTVTTDTNASPVTFTPSVDLADLKLELYSVSPSLVLGGVLDSNDSTLDNVEAIDYGSVLGPGIYALRVSNSNELSLDVSNYALAWTGTLVPEPGTVALLMVSATLFMRRRRV